MPWLFPSRDLVKIIGPPLHHLTALRQILRMIVSRPDVVSFSMSKLPFDDIRTKTMLVQNRAGSAAKSVAGGT